MATFKEGSPWFSPGWFGSATDGWFSDGWWGDDGSGGPGGGATRMLPLYRRRRWQRRPVLLRLFLLMVGG